MKVEAGTWVVKEKGPLLVRGKSRIGIQAAELTCGSQALFYL